MKLRTRILLPLAALSLSLLPGCAAAPLSPEEAQTIALNHAGLTGEEVQRLRAEPELHDRVPHYDIEFRHGRLEYEYEIHAETGDILSHEKDR